MKKWKRFFTERWNHRFNILSLICALSAPSNGNCQMKRLLILLILLIARIDSRTLNKSHVISRRRGRERKELGQLPISRPIYAQPIDVIRISRGGNALDSLSAGALKSNNEVSGG